MAAATLNAEKSDNFENSTIENDIEMLTMRLDAVKADAQSLVSAIEACSRLTGMRKSIRIVKNDIDLNDALQEEVKAGG